MAEAVGAVVVERTAVVAAAPGAAAAEATAAAGVRPATVVLQLVVALTLLALKVLAVARPGEVLQAVAVRLTAEPLMGVAPLVDVLPTPLALMRTVQREAEVAVTTVAVTTVAVVPLAAWEAALAAPREAPRAGRACHRPLPRAAASASSRPRPSGRRRQLPAPPPSDGVRRARRVQGWARRALMKVVVVEVAVEAAEEGQEVDWTVVDAPLVAALRTSAPAAVLTGGTEDGRSVVAAQ